MRRRPLAPIHHIPTTYAIFGAKRKKSYPHILPPNIDKIYLYHYTLYEGITPAYHRKTFAPSFLSGKQRTLTPPGPMQKKNASLHRYLPYHPLTLRGKNGATIGQKNPIFSNFAFFHTSIGVFEWTNRKGVGI